MLTLTSLWALYVVPHVAPACWIAGPVVVVMGPQIVTRWAERVLTYFIDEW